MAIITHRIVTVLTPNSTNMLTLTADEFKKKYGTAAVDSFKVSQPSNSLPNKAPNLGQLAQGQYEQAGQKISDSISKGADRLNALPNTGSIGDVAARTGTMLETGLGTAAGASQAVFAPFTAMLQKAMQVAEPVTKPIGEAVGPTLDPAIQPIKDWAAKHPRAATDLMDFITVAGTASADLGGAKNLLNTDVGALNSRVGGYVAQDVGNAVNSTVQGAKGVVEKAKSLIPGQGQPENPLQTTMDAVDPKLSGKAKVDAYREIATKGRGVAKANMFQEQGLAPAERTRKLATRLTGDTMLQDGTTVKGVQFGKDPIKNLETISQSLDDTEQALQRSLAGDPSMKYNLDKTSLLDKLNGLKDTKPGDFIGENGTIYDKVIEYANKIVDKTDDTINGGREARTMFDAEARRKFPTAFRDGAINTASPAGNAIKEVRDIMNQHLYETAPNGSDIQALIGREADLLRAADISAIKGAQMHGMNFLEQFGKDHPKLADGIKWGLLGLGGNQAVKSLTGLGL